MSPPANPPFPAPPPAEVVIVVPPFAALDWPQLGAHAAQASLRASGIDCRIWSLNLHFARVIGTAAYRRLVYSPGEALLGERLFRRAAFGGPALGADAAELLATLRPDPLSDTAWSADELFELEAAAFAFSESAAEALARGARRVVGASTSFEQTSAALALIGRVRAARPDLLTVLGGANCDGAMADGLSSLPVRPHVIFAGESDHTLPLHLGAWLRDGTMPPPIVRGAPVRDVDALALVDLTDFIDPLRELHPDLAAHAWLATETSRGCWWGEVRHCTFCGLNGEGMAFRAKSADRAIEHLRTLVERHGHRRVLFTDNIMPHAYHRTFLPRIPAEVGDLELFYEQKANLTLAQVTGLVRAGVRSCQPGIESLSTPTLRLMRKGVLARQNIATLRYGSMVGLSLGWNLLYDFPGDDPAEYRATLELLPLLRHLQPPALMLPLSIDRFSPYFRDPESFGITNLRPLPAYDAVFDTADNATLAYHFEGEWLSTARQQPELVDALRAEVEAWRASWTDPRARAMLQVNPAGPGQWSLVDSRSTGSSWLVLDEAHARAVLVGGPFDRVPAAKWAVRNRFAVRLDGWCVPLAVAAPGTLVAFSESEVDGPV